MRYQQKIKDQQLAAQTEVIAGKGVLGVKVNGMIVTPGALVEDQLAKVKSLGMDVIANAQSLPEILASAVAMTINQTMVQGIGYLQANVHREITNVTSNAQSQLHTQIKIYGSGSAIRRPEPPDQSVNIILKEILSNAASQLNSRIRTSGPGALYKH